VPIIASKIGGIPEMIVEGVNGMFFDPYKEGDLEQKILKFEKEVSIWRSKTEEIKKSAQKFTNYEKWIDEWEKLMQEIIYKRIAL
jgi:glycosyltransferase involved in cell wall biosynthesis